MNEEIEIFDDYMVLSYRRVFLIILKEVGRKVESLKDDNVLLLKFLSMIEGVVFGLEIKKCMRVVLIVIICSFVFWGNNLEKLEFVFRD